MGRSGSQNQETNCGTSDKVWRTGWGEADGGSGFPREEQGKAARKDILG